MSPLLTHHHLMRMKRLQQTTTYLEQASSCHWTTALIQQRQRTLTRWRANWQSRHTCTSRTKSR
ncbi:hypothetical protein E2C01_099536 [Portunus trituberculatus]|uniref:Uncharacterized protein n=1 Tax=Portunus trituberculatus TaxID=210409 RepID=A0A5B7KFM3_PORTR|nr:hypothetical protein [Portunus trituberculatus]